MSRRSSIKLLLYPRKDVENCNEIGAYDYHISPVGMCALAETLKDYRCVDQVAICPNTGHYHYNIGVKRIAATVEFVLHKNAIVLEHLPC